MASFYKIVSENWTWFFLQEPENKDYYTAPGILMKGAAVVCDRQDVKVFHRDGLFFKWEISSAERFSFRRIRELLSPRSKREFFTLLRMKNTRFPVTEPVAFAYNGIQSLLVTRKVEADSVTGYLCDKYEKGEALSKEFLERWGDFLHQFMHSGFYAADFHSGNLLFHRETNDFCLVDVYGIRKVLFRRQQRQQRMFFRHLMVASPFIKQSDLEYILQKSGVVFGQENFIKYLRYSKDSVMEIFRRRLGKREKSNIILRPDGKKWNFLHTEKSMIPPGEVEEVRTRDYLCRLFGIPGICLTEIYDDGTVVHEKICGAAEEADRLALLSRLAFAGLPAEQYRIVLNQTGNPAAVDQRLYTSDHR